jgi:hypothetical protein
MPGVSADGIAHIRTFRMTSSCSAIAAGPCRWWTALRLACCVAAPLPLVAAANPGAPGAEPQGPASPGAIPPGPTCAASANRFLSSLGVNTHIDQGYDPQNYVTPLRYLGIRMVRDGDRHVDSEIAVARATGVRFVINGGGDLHGLIASGEALAKAGALLAIEGPNEPNNFPINYDGQQGGGLGHSWYAVAAFQAALYKAVKADPLLEAHPVFGPSETGAETDDVGLQYRRIPSGDRRTIFPPGTRFSDFVNVHNYASTPRGGYGNNQAWNAANPTLNGAWDGLYGNSGVTWLRHFRGYPTEVLPVVPRVTTETGWDSVSDPGGQALQGAILTNTYLAQFKRGWRYTFIYELRDGEGGPGHQGLYDGDRPKIAAFDVHNLTTTLRDNKTVARPACLSFSLAGKSATVHDLLLEKSDGELDLVIWDERASGSDRVAVMFEQSQKIIRLFDITEGTDPVKVFKQTNRVQLSLSNHAVILAIGP